MEIKADIVDYMGKYEDGVIVLLTINFDGDFTEGTIFYNEENLVLTVDESVERKLGSPIELWDGYPILLVEIFKRLVPCSEVRGRLDEVDFSKYLQVEKSSLVLDEVEADQIITATQSNL
jgi:hypothetical protein